MGGVGENTWFDNVKDKSVSKVVEPTHSEWTSNDFSKKFGAYFNEAGNRNGFSTSLPSLIHQKEPSLCSSHGGDHGQNVDSMEDVIEPLDEDLVSRAIGDLLPDDEEELLAGIAAGFDSISINDMAEEYEEFDLFSNLGGLEMDGEVQEGYGMYKSGSKVVDGNYGGVMLGSSSNGTGSVVGEHPYGEHPSRTLFVRNINSNVEDSELRTLFEHYGDIRTLYTACKHRGFVMISYYDIRAARSAMRALQNKPLRRRKLDIHFSIPKDNPSDKDINQGTLVVFNLEASVSNDDLRHIFGQYGEVKEVRETPHKRHHKFIEFYDVRAAEAALRALNRSDIAGKRIKLEPSRPGGARRSLMQQVNQDPEQDEIHLLRHQSSLSISNSPSGHLPSWGQFGSPSPMDSGLSWSTHNSHGNSVSSMKKPPPGLANSLHSNPMRVGTIGSHLGRSNQSDAGISALHMGISGKGIPSYHAHSLPEYRNGNIPLYSSPVTMPTRTLPSHVTSHPDNEVLRLPTSNIDPLPFEHARGAAGIPVSGIHQQLNRGSGGNGSLTSPQFLWGNSNSYQQSMSMTWSSNTHSMSQSHNTVGLSQPFGYTGAINVPRISGSKIMISGGSHHVAGGSLGANGFFENGSQGPMSPHRSLMFPSSGIVMGSPFDMLGFDRGRSSRQENSMAQATDNKMQYQLDIDCILRGEDNRTTLMIKNIPNKYTSKMLLAAIDESHRGMYDFLYLPIDFKNKCNVGYAFINMTSPNHIVSLYQAFNGKKWEKFNSEKVALLAYARIQGKGALIAHFQNSSLMNEDKRCRPILFHSDGQYQTDEQEPSFLEVGGYTKAG